jgi:hypothetical protein
MVRTGDQAEERVSRQIAPYAKRFVSLAPKQRHLSALWGLGCTYRLTADIRVPDFGVKLHNRRPKWIFVWDFDVYDEVATFIGRAWGTSELSLQVS